MLEERADVEAGEIAGAAPEIERQVRTFARPVRRVQGPRSGNVAPTALAPPRVVFGRCGGPQSPKSNTLAFKVDVVSTVARAAITEIDSSLLRD